MVMLDEISEKSMLDNLKLRYKEGLIYVSNFFGSYNTANLRPVLRNSREKMKAMEFRFDLRSWLHLTNFLDFDWIRADFAQSLQRFGCI